MQSQHAPQSQPPPAIAERRAGPDVAESDPEPLGLALRALATLRSLLARHRERLVVGAVFVALGWYYVARYLEHGDTVVRADGHYSWIFARSLAFDGDLKLDNDYALCGDPWHAGADEGGGRPANPFYLGPALIWAPWLRALRVLAPIAASAPPAFRAGCAGPLAKWTLVLAPLAGLATLWIGYRVGRRFASLRAALAATIVVGLGSTLGHFASLVPSYSHVWTALGAAVAMLAWIRATERPESTVRWLVAGLGVGFAALMRTQMAVLLLMPALALLPRLVADLRARRLPLRTLAAGLAALVGFFLLFAIQLVANRKLYGAWWVVPQGKAYLQFAHAHPLLLLFAPHGGLLYWHPLMWLGVLGFPLLLARRDTRWLAFTLLLPLAIDVYVSASALDWHGNATFGARRLTSLAAPFVATGGVFLGAAWRWLQRGRHRLWLFAATGWLLPWLVINHGASNGNLDGRIPFDRGVPLAELYGGGARLGLDDIYDSLGNPAVLPASAIFKLRYGGRLRDFDVVAGGGTFVHSYRPIALQGPDTIELANPGIDPLLREGMTRVADGVALRAGAQGRMLVELSWPHVTHLAISARGPARLTLATGSFFRRRLVGTLELRGDAPVEIALPPGALDSGINELVVHADRSVTLASIRFIDRAKHDTSIR